MERLLMSGLTGSFEKDGILTPIQQLELERLQNQTAAKIINKLNALDSDSKFPMVAMATGFGKGRIIHKVIAETKKKRPNARILLIAGTKNILVEQTHVSLNEHQERDYFIVESDNDIEDDRYEIESELIDPSFSYKTGQYKSGADVEITTIQKIQIDALKKWYS
jgi:type I site-specific restriction endonuclease